MIYHVYILYSFKFDRFYTGISSNLPKRLNQHNNQEVGATAGGVPWRLIWTVAKNSRHDAEILERKIKNLSRKRKIQFMFKYKSCLLDRECLAILTRA